MNLEIAYVTENEVWTLNSKRPLERPTPPPNNTRNATLLSAVCVCLPNTKTCRPLGRCSPRLESQSLEADRSEGMDHVRSGGSKWLHRRSEISPPLRVLATASPNPTRRKVHIGASVGDRLQVQWWPSRRARPRDHHHRHHRHHPRRWPRGDGRCRFKEARRVDAVKCTATLNQRMTRWL